MKNLIIKPATLIPSTYSQIGNTLIPSKDCNNRKIARKFTQQGPRIKKDIYGLKTIDKPFISTFKRFDRPSPLISKNCQNCRTLSVPSVTDKTIYPCSLGKYGVTEYFNGTNKINNLGNFLYHRITTTNNQLYQQYRVTNKNNIELQKCCDFRLKTGVYNNGIINIAVFMDGCNILCIDNNTVTQSNVEDPCEYIVDGTDIIVEIISDNSITIDSIEYTLLPFENTTVADFGPEDNNGKLIPSGIDCNSGDLIITDIQITNNNLSIKENGVKINIGNKYQEYSDPSSSDVFRFYQNKSVIYVFNEQSIDNNYIIDKITCGCNYELYCKFTLQNGFYTDGVNQIPIISKYCNSICSETNYTPSLTNPCMYENISTSSTLKITANNEFNIGGSNYSLNTTIQTATLNKDFTGEFLLVPENSSNCPNITIKNVKFNNGTLTFEENGNSINLGNQYYDIGNNQWGYLYNNTQFYYINDPTLDPDTNAPIARKFTCNCRYDVFCCEYIGLKTGIYNNNDINVAVFMDGCTILCIDNDFVTQSTVDPCKYTIDGSTDDVEIKSDTIISINSVEYTFIQTNNTAADFGPINNNSPLIQPQTNCSPLNLVITDIEISSNILSFTENGSTISLGPEYQEYTDPSTSDVFRFYTDDNNSTIYTFKVYNPIPPVATYIIDKITCNCRYELCCEFALQNGFYTAVVGTSPIIAISQGCDSCFIRFIPYNILLGSDLDQSLENPCIYNNILPNIQFTVTSNTTFIFQLNNTPPINSTLISSLSVTTSNLDISSDVFTLNGFPSSCGDLIITNVKFTNGILTFEENGNSINLGNQYYDTGNDIWGYNNNGEYYIFYSPDSANKKGNPIIKADCDCSFST